NNHPGKKPGDILGEWPANAPESLVNSANTNGSAAGAFTQDLAATTGNVPNLLNSSSEGSGIDQSGQEKCPDFGSCANPHGIQIRADLKTMVTSDYAEPAQIVEDPVKPTNSNYFRRTVRVWSFSPKGCSGNKTPGASFDNPK